MHGILQIRVSDHQIELGELNELESMQLGEEKKKMNSIPFEVGDDHDLWTNPLQNKGNDATSSSWIQVCGPRIEDDMG